MSEQTTPPSAEPTKPPLLRQTWSRLLKNKVLLGILSVVFSGIGTTILVFVFGGSDEKAHPIPSLPDCIVVA